MSLFRRTVSCFCIWARVCLLVLLRRPYKLSLLISGGCNLRCQICSIWRNSNTTITLDEVRNIWEAFRIKPCWINLSGGEPSLNQELESILSFFVQMDRPLFVQLTSNGYKDCAPLIARVLDRNRRSIVRVALSIDGNAREHDAARGRRGSFLRAWHTYKELAKLQANHRELSVCMGVTISRCNYHCILPFLQRAIAAGVRVSINVANASEFYQNANVDSFESLPKLELTRLLRSIQYLLPKLTIDAILQINFLEAAIRYLEGKYTPIPCSSFANHLLVDSDLRLLNCVTQARPWTQLGRQRSERLRVIQETIQHPAQRIRSLRTEAKVTRCAQSCLTPCEYVVHAIAGMLQPLHAPRLMGVYLRVCLASALVGKHRLARRMRLDSPISRPSHQPAST